MSADHLMHFVVNDYGVGVRITCEHSPDDERFFARDLEGDFGDVGAITSDECWTLDWLGNLTPDEYLIGKWPDDPPSPCPVDCVWDDGLAVRFHAEREEEQ